MPSDKEPSDKESSDKESSDKGPTHRMSAGDRSLLNTLNRWKTGDRAAAVHSVTLERHWAQPAQNIDLQIAYRCHGSPEHPAITATIDDIEVSLSDPVRLQPVCIAKPWGQEIWYTGIEARGESQVVTDSGAISLAHYLAAAPDYLCASKPVVLLKILDPLPQPIVGELYFEVHQHKREVYIVTHLDHNAWPDQIGRIRFGMNQTLRAEFGNDTAFRSAFLDALTEYEQIRQAVDADPEPAVATELRQAERKARERVEQFSNLRPLTIGEVVVVPTWVPHSLQHGVRVIEFQTPTFERQIISFGQRVLTQDRWDSARAVPRLQLDLPAEAEFQAVGQGARRIARFDDFAVWQVDVAAGCSFQLPDHLPYALCIGLSGKIEVAGAQQHLQLEAEQACFIPGKIVSCGIKNPGTQAASCLCAAPGL